VSVLFDRAIDAIVHAGATVDETARPGIDDEEHHRLFMLLLRAATASRMRDEDFSRQQEIAATLTDDDISDRAAVARGATLLHRAWGNANEMRTKLRYNWHEFFKRFDVLLTPVAATAAFPHNRNPNRDERTVNVDGKSAPYAEQLFFAGLASLSYLPATAAPIGLTGEGLRWACRSSGRRVTTGRRSNSRGCLRPRSAALCRRRVICNVVNSRRTEAKRSRS
jgi:amidase